MLVSVYIRKDNIEAWKALSNKSEWVNTQLSGTISDFDLRVRKIVKQELESLQSLYS